MLIVKAGEKKLFLLIRYQKSLFIRDNISETVILAL